jgi:hypothetical protein
MIGEVLLIQKRGKKWLVIIREEVQGGASRQHCEHLWSDLLAIASPLSYSPSSSLTSI